LMQFTGFDVGATSAHFVLMIATSRASTVDIVHVGDATN
jgi:hypothetical protein